VLAAPQTNWSGHGPSRLATRLILRASGLRCQGAPTDEAFVEELSRVLVELQGKRPHARRQFGASSSSFALQQAASAGTFTFDGDLAGLSALAEPPRQWVLQHQPRELDSEIAEAVLQATRAVGGRALRRQLPLFREDARTLARSRAGSVVREHLRYFLESEDGRAWAASRAALRRGSRAAAHPGDGSDFDSDV
jgi:hypothetical protein